MKRLSIVFILSLAVAGCKQTDPSVKETSSEPIAMTEQKSVETIYQFTVKDINGDDFDFADLKGKKIMVVNTASKCGLTPQYEQLQSLYERYGGSGFTIIGFPANNFGQQEPGSNTEIAEFCQLNYGVSFPMMSKISVKGEDMHEIYRFLTQKELNGLKDSEVAWNFQKYLIDENGTLAEVIEPQMLPDDKKIIDWIESK